MIVEPLVILVVLPAAIGVAAEVTFRNPRKASLVALVASLVLTAGFVQWMDPGAAWNWLAALMVCPLPIAIAVAASLLWFGRQHAKP